MGSVSPQAHPTAAKQRIGLLPYKIEIASHNSEQKRTSTFTCYNHMQYGDGKSHKFIDSMVDLS